MMRRPETPANRNRRTFAALAVVVIGMTGLAYASVPLYRLFCQVTGYGGTTQTSESLPDQVLEREISVRFNADISRELPWKFRPAQKEISLRIGEQGLAFYKAGSRAEKITAGTAVYNVTPLKAGRYFNKIDCFCFAEQSLEPGQEVDMPVSFYIDPAIADDPNMSDISTITLSYTFFPVIDNPVEDAVEVGRETVSGSPAAGERHSPPAS